ncbi:MAG: MBL fold metallo-hydrolase [Dethiobacteria bacterium]
MTRKFETIVDTSELKLSRLETDPFGTNAYVLTCKEKGESVLFDAPGNADLIRKFLEGSRVLYILLTHGHMDHTMALEDLYDVIGAELAAHEDDADSLPVKPDRLFYDGETIQCGNLEIEAIHTPGHTPGSLCYRLGNILISGDTLFPGGPGKTGSPESFIRVLASIREKILTLPDETKIIPGHGDSTTVGKERQKIEAFISRGFDQKTHGDVTW